MKELLDSFWRAAAYCLLPRVMVLTLLPLLVGGGLALLLGWLYWEAAVSGVRATLESWSLVDAALRWIESITGPAFRAVLAPLLVVMLAVPVVVVVSLLLVALLLGPAVVALVSARRFAQLEQRRGAGLLLSGLWSVGCTLLALLAMAVTLPLWFIPPLILLLPPLIWGWLTFRVMSFDALAQHADASERRELIREHHWPLLAMGIVCGYLGAAPSLLWAFGAVALVFAPILIAASIWLYTLVFAFSALWFTHYALAALQALRARKAAAAAAAAGPVIDAAAIELAAPSGGALPPQGSTPAWPGA